MGFYPHPLPGAPQRCAPPDAGAGSVPDLTDQPQRPAKRERQVHRVLDDRSADLQLKSRRRTPPDEEEEDSSRVLIGQSQRSAKLKSNVALER